MQSYKLALAVGESKVFQILGDLFVYESGTVTPTNGDTRIIIGPGNGNEMTLRPGQGFRLTPGETSQAWTVKAFDPAVAIAGQLNIGGGEFFDANTLNKFTLDATFANNVKVTNTTGERVPVTLDTAQTQPVSIAGTLPVSIAGIVNVAGTTVQYTNAFADSAKTATAATVVFTPAANVNGAYIELAEMSGHNSEVNGTAQTISLIAKTSAPATSIDGDVIMVTVNAGVLSGTTNAALNQFNEKLPWRVKIPAGKGLYLNRSGIANGSANVTVLYTLI